MRIRPAIASFLLAAAAPAGWASIAGAGAEAAGPEGAGADVAGASSMPLLTLTPEVIESGSLLAVDEDVFGDNRWSVACRQKPFNRCALIGGPWRFRAGDDPSYARPDFDDSSWSFAATSGTKGTPEHWDGFGWFRLRLRIDPRLVGQELGFISIGAGDVEFFLDGVSIGGFGDVDRASRTRDSSIAYGGPPVRVVFNRTEHLLALRFANPRHNDSAQMLFASGKFIFLGRLDTLGVDAMLEEMRRFGIHRYFGGAAIALAVLHLLLYLFHPKARENLFFALYNASVGAIVHSASSLALMETVGQAMPLLAFFRLSIVATSLFGLSSMYAIFYEKFPRPFWIFVASAAILTLLAHETSIAAVYTYAMIALLEEARVVVTAMIRKKPGARIIGIGGFAFFVSATLQMLGDLGIVPYAEPFIYLYGLAVLLFMMSFYLAYRFARTSRDLAAQLIQVRELSEITLEQERKAKEDELTRRLLEADNERKERELEEAKKLEQALADLKQVNDNLKQTQTQLVQSEKMASLGMLVAGVAHEINTPIGAIASVHDSQSRALEKLRAILADACPALLEGDPKLRASLKVIEDATRVVDSGSSRVAEIVKRLRSFARLDEAELKKVDIHEGIEDTLMLLHHQMKHGVTVKKNFGAVPPLACYPGQLNQVLLNILVNARQALKDGKGEIEVSTAVEDGRAVIRIRDDGMGIKPENLGRIFDPGFTTKGAGVGTGLGLSICYQIMQQHNGEIRVESELGKGTTFSIVLPMDLG